MQSKEEKKAQAAVLRLNFPVSSGMQHRVRESEWEPVTTGSATSTTASTMQAEAKPEREVGSVVSLILLCHCITACTVVQAVVKATSQSNGNCLLYTSPSPRDGLLSRMPSSA